MHWIVPLHGISNPYTIYLGEASDVMFTEQERAD